MFVELFKVLKGLVQYNNNADGTIKFIKAAAVNSDAIQSWQGNVKKVKLEE